MKTSAEDNNRLNRLIDGSLIGEDQERADVELVFELAAEGFKKLCEAGMSKQQAFCIVSHYTSPRFAFCAENPEYHEQGDDE